MKSEVRCFQCIYELDEAGVETDVVALVLHMDEAKQLMGPNRVMGRRYVRVHPAPFIVVGSREELLRNRRAFELLREMLRGDDSRIASLMAEAENLLMETKTA